MTTTGWFDETRSGSVAELHGIEPRAPYGRRVWRMDPVASALVLGSTQRPSVTRPGLEIVVRRSGGGAVFLDVAHAVWVDVFVPRGDALWDDDVNRSFFWLGEVWASALRTLGSGAEVHRGALDRTAWSRLVCFAGIGPGEVSVGGRKVVGLSQRRTRHGARFQCVAYTAPAAISSIVELLGEPEGDEREALRAHLDVSTGVVEASRDQLVAAFVAALP